VSLGCVVFSCVKEFTFEYVSKGKSCPVLLLYLHIIRLVPWDPMSLSLVRIGVVSKSRTSLFFWLRELKARYFAEWQRLLQSYNSVSAMLVYRVLSLSLSLSLSLYIYIYIYLFIFSPPYFSVPGFVRSTHTSRIIWLGLLYIDTA
jgi:hypothetical protein